MLTEVWLKIKGKKKWQSWTASSISAFKKKPDTAEDEVALKLTLEIPDSLFEQPVFEAKIALPNIKPALPDKSEIASHIEKTMNKKFGFKIKVDMGENSQKEV